MLAGCGQEPPDDSRPEPSAADTGGREAVIAVMGDLMVHEEQLSAARGQDGEYDFSPSLAWVAGDIAAADLAIGNLETVLAGEEAGYSGYPRFNTPDSFALALADAGLDALTTANNHCLDQGEAGLRRTLEVLDRVGIAHTGTFATPEESRVAVLEANGIRVALAAFTFGTNDSPEERPGLVNRLDRDTARAVLREARESGADWVIALPHMGREYAAAPEPVYREWADYLLACGADAVLAAHPHVLQPLEVRERAAGPAVIAWSLGNFLSYQCEPPRETGVLLKLWLEKGADGRTALRRVSVLPVWTQQRTAAGQKLARTLPIHDALVDYGGENALRIAGRDYARLLAARDEVAGLYLGGPVARGRQQREYVVYSAEGDTREMDTTAN